MVRLECVSKTYPSGTEALRDITFHIGKGEFVSVIGPSGSGKTTLFRLLNGSLSCTKGSIVINGQAFHHAKGKAKRNIQKSISMIYQDYRLVEQSSSFQNVLNAALTEQNFAQAMVNYFTKEQKERALDALERVGLLEQKDQPVHSLSGGQKQRIAIARAIMQRANLLLADEPVASLDPVTGKQALDLLSRLQKEEGMTILMNSHNVRFSLLYSERIIGLAQGNIVFDEKREHVGDELLKRAYGSRWEEILNEEEK